MESTRLRVKTGQWLLPRDGIDPAAWACVACDQFTSQPEYWAEARVLVEEAPSALNVILPECELADAPRSIPLIHAAMRQYLEQGVLRQAVRDGWILVERELEGGTRAGLMVLLDLEGYDDQPGFGSLIRPTEGTVPERVPPRVRVRRGAELELGHVLALLDDPQRSVVEPLYQKRLRMEKLYDFPLMLGGGRLAGYAVDNRMDIAAALQALERLLEGIEEPKLLYAVGDGNHSLAAAKAFWEELRPTLPLPDRQTHPARYSMVELNNIHDSGVRFEPIHRAIFGASGNVMEGLQTIAGRLGISVSADRLQGDILYIEENRELWLTVSGPRHPLAIGALQELLDEWVKETPGAVIDYIHGGTAARELVQRKKAIAFLLPPPDKRALFHAIRKGGVLPRKTFSMGEAHEKRYYMEARRLI